MLSRKWDWYLDSGLFWQNRFCQSAWIFFRKFRKIIGVIKMHGLGAIGCYLLHIVMPYCSAHGNFIKLHTYINCFGQNLNAVIFIAWYAISLWCISILYILKYKSTHQDMIFGHACICTCPVAIRYLVISRSSPTQICMPLCYTYIFVKWYYKLWKNFDGGGSL